MQRIINGKRYNTEVSQIVATDRYWDGSNWDRRGRTQTLYKTKNGNFFMLYETRWQGERDRIEAVTIDEAKQHYESLPEQEMDYKETFGIEPEEA